MSYDDFLSAVKNIKVNLDPYMYFNIDKLFIYEGYDKKKERKPFIVQKWETGGVSGGSCWESSDPQHYDLGDSEKPKGFVDLEAILQVVAPSITFLQYRLLEKIIKTGEETHYEYYGNYTTYGYELILMEDLYKILAEFNLI